MLPGGRRRRRCGGAPQWGDHTSLRAGRSGRVRPSPLEPREAVTGASGGCWLQLVSPWSFTHFHSFRKSSATSVAGRWPTSTAPFMRRIAESEMRPESSASTALSREYRSRISCRTIFPAESGAGGALGPHFGLGYAPHEWSGGRRPPARDGRCRRFSERVEVSE